MPQMVTLSYFTFTACNFRNMKPVYVGKRQGNTNTVITLNINIFSFY